MKLSYMRKLAAAVLTAVIAASTLSVTTFASPVFNDVPSTHWAYSFISAVADRGLMLGDTFANFRPDELLDKFETSKILARSAGYKYENVSAEEQAFYNACYEKNKNFLNQYSARFTRWNSSADREIAFLLEKEILTAADLNQFVITGTSNIEQVRALSRSEAAVFITKLIGRTSQALSHTTTNLFGDDAIIPATAKPYVYYLRGINVIGGDNNGNYNPGGAVTRAVMATMLARALNIMAEDLPGTTTAVANPNTTVTSIEGIFGTIDAYYSNLNAVQIVLSSGERKIYRMSSKVTIHVDGFVRTGADLREGMVVSGVLENDEIIELRAQNVTSPSNVTPSTPNVQYSEIDGTISAIDQEGTVRTVSIEIKTVNPRDNTIVSDIRIYALASDVKITRGGDNISFANIARGDIVIAQVSGGTAYELALEESIIVLKDARLIEKRLNQQTNQGSYIVTDTKGKQYEFRVAANTTISRRNVGATSWDKLRVGDVLDLTAEFGVLRDITAYGVLSTADGWIDSVFVGTFQSYITLRDSYGEIKRYYVIPDSTDVYSLRVGNRMRLRLDSDEISSVMLLEEARSDVLTGYVDTIRTDSITLVNTQPHGTDGRRTIEIDSATVFTNTRTGDHVNFNAIRTGQRVYVVCYTSGSNRARTVTILSD